MKRAIRHQSSVIRFVICALLITYHLSLITSSAFATDSSTPSANVKSKLDSLKQEIASKAAQIKQEINRKLQNKAFVGVVKSKSTTSLTLASKNGSRMVSINQDTIFEEPSQKNSKFSQNTLKEESYIAALGEVDDTGVLVAKKVLLLTPLKTQTEQKVYIWGQIAAVSEQLITIKNRNQTWVLATNSQTEIKTSVDHQVAVGDLKVEDTIIASGKTTPEKTDFINTQFIYIVSEKPLISPKASSVTTSSASIKPTPTQKPSPSPK